MAVLLALKFLLPLIVLAIGIYFIIYLPLSNRKNKKIFSTRRPSCIYKMTEQIAIRQANIRAKEEREEVKRAARDIDRNRIMSGLLQIYNSFSVYEANRIRDDIFSTDNPHGIIPDDGYGDIGISRTNPCCEIKIDSDGNIVKKKPKDFLSKEDMIIE